MNIVKNVVGGVLVANIAGIGLLISMHLIISFSNLEFVDVDWFVVRFFVGLITLIGTLWGLIVSDW